MTPRKNCAVPRGPVGWDEVRPMTWQLKNTLWFASLKASRREAEAAAADFAGCWCPGAWRVVGTRSARASGIALAEKRDGLAGWKVMS